MSSTSGRRVSPNYGNVTIYPLLFISVFWNKGELHLPHTLDIRGYLTLKFNRIFMHRFLSTP